MNRPPSFAEFMAMQGMTPAMKNQTAPAPAAPWGVGNAPGLNLPVNPQDKYSGNIANWNDLGSPATKCPPGMQWAEDSQTCYATPGYGTQDVTICAPGYHAASNMAGGTMCVRD